ncbi:SprT family zinc-dependent metalloprotease [Leeuwenhoekiella aequorea]|uniref:M48 family metallopeptidase n=1 Tax=Leeuwenhoekiella aequorea TaxID=283736 RepID=UPI00352ED4B5|tara:strand:+ start:9541 stop:10194 length:654 start_codon:yes stop_codon:yes gene_type:complete
MSTSQVEIIRKDVKHARLRVSEDESVRLIVPLKFSKEAIDEVLNKRKHWITKKQQFFAKKSQITLNRNQLLLFGQRYNYFYDSNYKYKVTVNHDHFTISSQQDLLDSKVQERWYKKIAKDYLVKRTEELASKLDFKYNNIYIRSPKNKWGNCSTDKNISYNWRLIKAPKFVIDYLIVHELLHTIVMHHRIKFWVLLRSFYPDYKAAIKWLNTYGNSL